MQKKNEPGDKGGQECEEEVSEEHPFRDHADRYSNPIGWNSWTEIGDPFTLRNSRRAILMVVLEKPTPLTAVLAVHRSHFLIGGGWPIHFTTVPTIAQSSSARMMRTGIRGDTC